MALNLNKSRGTLLKSSKNLQHLVGINSYEAIRIAEENSICCGLGRKVLYFSKAQNGAVPTTIKKYPVKFNGTQYFSKVELAEALTIFFGVGYIVYVPNSGNAVVIGAQYKKSANGELEGIPDYIVIS